jgi:tRNA(fMet)-specific endonuclease VapC
LEKTGNLVGAMDMLIAAHARSCGATLVTNNQREFGRIKGLALINWGTGEKRIKYGMF